MKEDTIEFLLNVKAIRLRPLSGQGGRLTLEVEGEGEVTAADIQPSPDFEIVNPELLLATLDSPQAKLSVEFNVEIGKGYLPVEKQRKDNMPLGALPVDAIFTPIRKVNYRVEPLRIEEKEYEQLILEVWTDGTTSPEEAVSQSAHILCQQLEAFKRVSPTIPLLEEKKAPTLPTQQYNIPIEELGLKERTKNALRRAGINTLGELLSASQEELKALPSFGDKAMEEVREKLYTLGLTLREKK
jgi:DNA-directed RNA polymerase subunit alpha